MPVPDKFPAASLTSSAIGGEAVAFESPPEDFMFSERTRALYVGGEGTVMVIFAEGDDPVPHVCPSGMQLNVRAVGIAADGTTATGIVGWF